MSAPVNTGGPAYPFIEWRSPDGMIAFRTGEGMTLRDWFAGQTVYNAAMHLADYLEHEFEVGSLENEAANLAKSAYAIADALLAEREKGGA